MRIELNGNQDVDLYARFGQPIAIAAGKFQADFISETTTGNETITVSPASSPSLRAGTYYIGISNFGPGAANFTVKATVTGGASNNPAPALASLSPNNAAAGSGGLQLTVFGSNFLGGSVVRWNNSDRQTTFIDKTTLKAAIPASDLATGGSVNVTVFNPAPGGGSSGPLAFTITGGGTQTEVLSADDGTAEQFFVDDNSIDVVRLSPLRYPARLQAIRIFVAAVPNRPNPVGAQIRLIAFAGAPGTTAPANNPGLLLDRQATIPNFTSAGFVDFPIANGPTITEGDIYVGLRGNQANGAFAFFDVNGQQYERSFYSQNNGATYQGPTSVKNSQGVTRPVNLMVRAVMSTVSTGIEGDVAPRSQGNGTVTITDWVQIGRFVSGQDTPSGSEFQRADTAPRETQGNGALTITDWVQAGRYAAGLDPATPAGGPASPGSSGRVQSLAAGNSGARQVRALNDPPER
ncbi:MAG: IPT/TIG domain-containing protein, partial [Gammaproteobacteria bacterium]